MHKHTQLLLSLSAGLSMLLVTSTSSAGYLVMVGGDAVWPSTDDPSPICYVGIVNDQGLTDCLAGWQLKLVIVPIGDATGQLRFGMADLPRLEAEEYLLWGDSGVLDGPDPPPEPLITGPADEVVIGDYALSGFGSEIPASVKTLAKMSFVASGDAHGAFGLAVVPGPDSSFWASLDPVEFTAVIHAYGNVPATGDRVVVGRVLVGVPEPHVLAMLVTGIVFLLVGGRRLGRHG
ncbi:MAG: hypothetical protein NTW96_26145 [Planctomycetia bacterium]|nr:hypothetical protein [Planctomycetia bacterium]